MMERRHVHVIRRGYKNSHRGENVAKIWIEENGQKKVEVAWSELTAKEEVDILCVINDNWDTINKMIDQVFSGNKVQILRMK